MKSNMKLWCNRPIQQIIAWSVEASDSVLYLLRSRSLPLTITSASELSCTTWTSMIHQVTKKETYVSICYPWARRREWPTTWPLPPCHLPTRCSPGASWTAGCKNCLTWIKWKSIWKQNHIYMESRSTSSSRTQENNLTYTWRQNHVDWRNKYRKFMGGKLTRDTKWRVGKRWVQRWV